MTNEATRQCAFRLPESLVQRVEAYRDAMSNDHPGVKYTLADAVRALLTRALDSEEERRPKAGKRTSPARPRRS